MCVRVCLSVNFRCFAVLKIAFTTFLIDKNEICLAHLAPPPAVHPLSHPHMRSVKP